MTCITPYTNSILMGNSSTVDDHLTPVLKPFMVYQLVWNRITFKMMVLAWKCLRNIAPRYLMSFLCTSGLQSRLSAFAVGTIQYATGATYSDNCQPAEHCHQWSNDMELATQLSDMALLTFLFVCLFQNQSCLQDRLIG